MNLVEILKNVPKGTKLYSTIAGYVIFEGIYDNELYPILCTTTTNNEEITFTKEGIYESTLAGECVIFPSKENRDWNTFNPIKPGDIIASKNVIYLVKNFDRVLCSYNKKYDIFQETEFPIKFKDYHFKFKDYHYANDDEKRILFDAIEKAGYKYRPEDISIEKCETKYKFKPFDKVICRNKYNNGSYTIWHCDIFYTISKDNEYLCIGGKWNECIPYDESLKHLIGTKDNI